jgi:hypothetical protein
MESMEVAVRVRIEHLPEGVFLATSNDLPGLVAQGRTVAEALEIARDSKETDRSPEGSIIWRAESRNVVARFSTGSSFAGLATSRENRGPGVIGKPCALMILAPSRQARQGKPIAVSEGFQRPALGCYLARKF